MVTPNQTQMNEFLEGDIDSPISMVNLLKFKKKAEYEDGRDTELSGEEAYAIYAMEVHGLPLHKLHMPLHQTVQYLCHLRIQLFF